MDIKKQLTEEFNLRPDHVENILNLLDEGNTIPFIARYRKEMTGSIDDQVLRKFADRYEYLTNLEKRKEEVRAAIEAQGKLTEDIVLSIASCETMTGIEEVYRPFKQKKKTRADVAREKGLDGLAAFIMKQEGDPYAEADKYIDEEKGVKTRDDAIAGARDIIAENVSNNAEIRKKLRTLLEEHGEIQVKLVKDDGKGTYDMYADYSELIPEIKNHRVLAVNRGEKDECLKVKLVFEPEIAKRIAAAKLVKSKGACADIIVEAVSDSYDRLIQPSIEREVRNNLTDRASDQAVRIFEVNLRPLLMQPPVKGRTMGLDPGQRTGCKVAVVDETGKVLDTAVIYPIAPHNRVEDSRKTLKNLIVKHAVENISIGNGTGGKETEIFVAEMLKDLGLSSVSYAVVSEAGASKYSASPVAAEEFPDYDLTLRSAISIARRLQDPLAELVKIDCGAIGVGQYQHDMDAKKLDAALGGVLEDCVNSVGVDLNTASPHLLKYVAGLKGVAKNVVAYREEIGRFTDRKELLKVPKLGPKAFEQCAGFLRIAGGKNILDNTAVHPESYESTKKLLKLFGYTDEDVAGGNLKELPAKVKAYGEERTAKEVGLDRATMNDIIIELLKPGRDVRDSLPKPVLRKDIITIENLKVGMIVEGAVRNVIDFGAFIDIGVHQDGLVHVSEICDRYIKHPSDVLKVGQHVTVEIISLDIKKQRIGLSMKRVNKKQA